MARTARQTAFILSEWMMRMTTTSRLGTMMLKFRRIAGLMVKRWSLHSFFVRPVVQNHP